MKRKHNEGFSLIDVLVGITLLALVVIPISSGLIMSSRMNAKAEQLLQDQLAVASKVEELMATGIPTGYTFDDSDADYSETLRIFKDSEESNCYKITVKKGEVSVTTYVGGGS